MRHEERDLARMWDMLDASRRIIEFTAGMTWEEYCHDELTRLAIERLVPFDLATPIGPSHTSSTMTEPLL